MLFGHDPFLQHGLPAGRHGNEYALSAGADLPDRRPLPDQPARPVRPAAHRGECTLRRGPGGSAGAVGLPQTGAGVQQFHLFGLFGRPRGVPQRGGRLSGGLQDQLPWQTAGGGGDVRLLQRDNSGGRYTTAGRHHPAPGLRRPDVHRGAGGAGYRGIEPTAVPGEGGHPDLLQHRGAQRELHH